jgi:hypothetical protein
MAKVVLHGEVWTKWGEVKERRKGKKNVRMEGFEDELLEIGLSQSFSSTGPHRAGGWVYIQDLVPTEKNERP